MNLDNIYRLSTFTALGSLLFLLVGLNNIENYIHWLIFPILCLIAGATFGILIFQLLKLKYHHIGRYKKARNNSGILMPLCFACSLTFFGLGRLLNEHSIIQQDCHSYKIHQTAINQSKYKNYYILIENNNQLLHVEIPENIYKNYSNKDSIPLCIKTGYLKFKFFSYNMTPNPNSN